uniref:Artemin n=1 Tax=Latimeria chalumnae TaxID=7897 RepID=H3BAE5_LATCH
LWGAFVLLLLWVKVTVALPAEEWQAEEMPAQEVEDVSSWLVTESQGLLELEPEDGVDLSLRATWDLLYCSQMSYVFNQLMHSESSEDISPDLLSRAERSPADLQRQKGSRKNRKRPKPTSSSKNDSRGCRLRTLRVKVHDLGLGYNSDEIVLFKYCSGACQRSRTNYDLTLTSLLKYKVIPHGEKVSGHPCCRPTRYEPVSFMDNQNTWQTVEKLSAAECSC